MKMKMICERVVCRDDFSWIGGRSFFIPTIKLICVSLNSSKVMEDCFEQDSLVDLLLSGDSYHADDDFDDFDVDNSAQESAPVPRLTLEMIEANRVVERRRELARKRYQLMASNVNNNSGKGKRKTQKTLEEVLEQQERARAAARARYANNKPESQIKQRIYRRRHRDKIKANYAAYCRAKAAIRPTPAAPQLPPAANEDESDDQTED